MSAPAQIKNGAGKGAAKQKHSGGDSTQDLPWWKHYMRDSIAEAARLTPHAICARWLLRDRARLQSPLPSEDSILASMARLTPEDFAAVKDEALRGYGLDDAGWW